MFVKPQMRNLQMYVPGKSKGGIKLSSNENPFGASSRVHEAMLGFSSFERYPDGSATVLKEKVAAFLNVGTDQLVFGAGGDEVIQMISRSVLSPGDNVIQAFPTFPQYEHHALIEGADIKNIPLKDGFHDLDAMLGAIDGKTKIIWVCNPNNPTGTYVSKTALREFIGNVPKNILIAIDEAYVEYVDEPDFPNSLELIKKHENVVVLRTFSKIYGLASFRIGYGIGNPEFIRDLNVGRLPFNTGTLAQLAAVAALSDQDFVKKSFRANLEGLKQYSDFFEESQIPYYRSAANFIFIPVANALGMQIGEKINEAGYIVRSFTHGVRITIGKYVDNEAVISCLSENLDLLR